MLLQLVLQLLQLPPLPVAPQVMLQPLRDLRLVLL
jgi:hypothetical protein